MIFFFKNTALKKIKTLKINVLGIFFFKVHTNVSIIVRKRGMALYQTNLQRIMGVLPEWADKFCFPKIQQT